jgi:hypothetical protein
VPRKPDVFTVTCACGFQAEAADSEDIWQIEDAHYRDAHPELTSVRYEGGSTREVGSRPAIIQQPHARNAPR